MRYGRQGGYTLVETVLVSLLLGLLFSLAVPALGKVRDGMQVETVAWQMAQDIRLARQKALEEAASMRVRFLPNMDGVAHSNAYWLFLTPSQPFSYQAVKMPGGVVMLGQSFDPNQLSYDLTFTAQGAPSRGGTIYLKSARGTRYNVVVTPVTARVRVIRP